ncbi:apolipoprotein N-acyltransferase [Thermogutta sp.]|uniref:apolipoprotein N-acyltransferase n=1 Tax=Thermogutta sp. TaxID=1962930 RepID=UPI00321FD500
MGRSKESADRNSRQRFSGESKVSSEEHQVGRKLPVLTAGRRTSLLAAIGAILLWMALPPLQIAPLAWLAPCFWCALIACPRSLKIREYLILAAVGFLFWMAALHWLRLPHWATSFGWVALSFYLAWYLPSFVGFSRIGVHRFRIPLPLAAGTVWAGLEVARAHLLTGFTMASLGHTQYRWLSLIQIADLVGTYGVGWVMIFVSGCLYLAARRVAEFRWALAYRRSDQACSDGTFLKTPARQLLSASCPIVAAGVVLGAVVLYGHYCLQVHAATPQTSTVRVALIQGSQDIRLEDGDEKRERIHRHYLQLAFLAARQYRNLDLMVWPETVYGGVLIDADSHPALPPEWLAQRKTGEEFLNQLIAAKRSSEAAMERLAYELDSRLILGVETVAYTKGGIRYYNSAAFVGKCSSDEVSPKTENIPDANELENLSTSAQVSEGASSQNLNRKPYCYLGRYDKMHLVMFGEYVPFAEQFPLMRYLTPLSTNTTPGKLPRAFSVRGVRFCPNICYESVIPHLIREQILELRKLGSEPDVLVNLTNDGWFWGSSELDMHLICGVFRAVETRKPFLIAANTGFSAVIDATGRILSQGPRRDVAILVTEVGKSGFHSWYLDHGIIPNSIFLFAVVLMIAAELLLWVINRWCRRPRP